MAAWSSSWSVSGHRRRWRAAAGGRASWHLPRHLVRRGFSVALPPWQWLRGCTSPRSPQSPHYHCPTLLQPKGGLLHGAATATSTTNLWRRVKSHVGQAAASAGGAAAAAMWARVAGYTGAWQGGRLGTTCPGARASLGSNQHAAAAGGGAGGPRRPGGGHAHAHSPVTQLHPHTAAGVGRLVYAAVTLLHTRACNTHGKVHQTDM